MPESEGVQVGGLGDPALLQKIDKLRSLNISPAVPLTQLVVVGDRSVGKSSVLESLTGFPFPRATKYGTGYIIEVVYRRSNTERILASMRPAPRSCMYRAAELRAFEVELLPKDISSKGLQDLFKQVSIIRQDIDLRYFEPEYYRDVLQIEITGPREKHLTIIDLPGSPDIQRTIGDTLVSSVVESIVADYIKTPRTIILAVTLCRADIKARHIVKNVEKVDPGGRRSIAILTKPDLIAEYASKKEIVDLVNQEEPFLECFIVRNRKECDPTSDLAQRNYVERVFFNESPWDQLDKARVGIGSIRSRLQKLLIGHTEQYFFEVNEEVTATIAKNKRFLKLLGEPRVDTDKQRTYLVRAAIQFSDIVRHALDMKNNEHPVLSQNSRLQLAANLQENNEAFTKMLFMRGHHYKFKGEDDTNNFQVSPMYQGYLCRATYQYPELQGLLHEPFHCRGPSKGDLIDYIQQIYSPSPRDELDVFGNPILPIVFREQSEKWNKITLTYLSNVIYIIHEFIYTAMKIASPDGVVRRRFQKFLSNDLLDYYRRAMKHTEFLLQIECKGKVATSNPHFSELLASNREKRLKHTILEDNKDASTSTKQINHVTVETDAKTAITGVTLPSTEHIYGDVHDIIKTYYEIARARFLDGIDQQAVTHFLLDGEQSVFQLFTPERVLSMTSEEVESIAKESPASTKAREEWKQEIKSLKKALEVLHT